MNKLYFALSVVVLCALSAKGQTTVSFTCPTTTTTWTVPAGVTSIQVDVQGANGGLNSVEGVPSFGYTVLDRGGHGARVQATLAVTPGQVLNIYVGGIGPNGITGSNVPGGFNGGGGGKYAPGAGLTPNICGGGGGGASDIRIGGTALANRVVVAGGGGGAGGNYVNPYVDYDRGGDGGGTTGEAGWAGGTVYGGGAGGGGTPTAGGGGGASLGFGLGAGGAGTLGTGGNGGNNSAGGGGGGGYYGGGGSCYSGGGGGSSYTDAVLATSVTHTRGYNTGCGVVTIIVPGCSGTPTTGTVSASVTSGCGPYTSVLNLTGASGGAGITYQWQSSPDGLTWTNITGGTTLPYTVTVSTTTYYRCVVTCTTSGISTNSAAIECFEYPVPAAITGPGTVCTGLTITLADVTTGGTWSSSASGTASVVSGTGVVTGVAALGGTATITYTTTGGCTATTVVTVNTNPPLISGSLTVCTGNTTTLTDLTTGGSWTSLSGGIATINSAGVVFGLSVGTSVISYTLGSGCATASTVTVYATPASITGPGNVCTGANITLADVTPGGTWTSSFPGIGGVGSTTGIVTGAGTGTTTISYTTAGGCFATAPVTVNLTPLPISGSASVCLGYNVTLTDATAGGSWSSTVPLVAPIGAGTGILTGNTLGTTTISYVMPTGCYQTYAETVNALPGPISGTPYVCKLSTTTLTDAGGGTWSSSNGSISTAGAATGAIYGVSAGTDTITYTIGSGCFVTQSFTVNPLPAAISGNVPFCVNATVTLADATSGGSWAIGGTQATISSTTGVASGVSNGNPTVTYTAPVTGCQQTAVLTVNPVPGAIAGILLLCDSSTSILLNGLTGGVWTSSNTSVATINPGTGAVFGVSPGLDTITYTIALTGCKTTSTLTVQPPPAPIGGPTALCVGSNITLSDLITGGFWTSGTMANATIDSFSGQVSGVNAGTALISYTLGVCATSELITINAVPAPIGGLNSVCTGGGITTLSESTPGGSWYSGSPGVASVNISTGVLTGFSLGTALISYVLPGTGCLTTELITVDPLPMPITGVDSVCVGYTVLLSDPLTGGTFSSGSGSIASVNSTTGMVTGVSGGNTYISYTLGGTGCSIAVPFHVNPILSVSSTLAAYPGDTICAGNPETFTATTTNGGTAPVYQWLVNGSLVPGATSGTYTFTPSNGNVIKCIVTSNATCAIPATATSNSITMTVNPVTNPAVTMIPGGNDTICTGTTQTYSVTSLWGGTAPVYLWTVNWIPVGTGTTSFTYTPANGDIVRCGMISSSPCPVPDTAFAIDTVVVKDYATPMVSINSIGSLSACQGNMVTLTANATWGGWGPVYSWTLNGNAVPGSGNTYTYIPADSDLVVVTMRSNYPCVVPTDSAEGQIRISVDPVIVVTITDSYGGLVTEGAYDTLVAHVQNGGTDPTYQWYRNGVPVPGANNYKLAMNDFVNGDSVSVMVRTGSGSACEGVRGYNWIFLEVAPAGVGTSNTGISDAMLMPNPNGGLFTVSGRLRTGTGSVAILVTNVLGQQVYSAVANVRGGRINEIIDLGRELPAGIYNLVLVPENGAREVLRFYKN